MKTWTSKLRFAAFLAAVPVAAGEVFSQGPQCAVPQCAAPYYTPNCNAPAVGDQQSNPVSPPGMFVAPPPSGDVIGESNGLGWHGPSLHIPQSTIRFPSLQFGSLFRSRRGPEMITDQSRASFQSQPSLKMQLTRPQGGASGVQQSNPVTPPNCTVPPAPCFGQATSPQTDEIVRLQQQVSQLTALVGQLAATQQGQPQPAQEQPLQAQPVQGQPVHPSTIQPAGYQASSRQLTQPQPAVAAVPSQAEKLYLEQYEQKCRELEVAQEQLAATQWEYQALLEARQQKIILERDARMRKQLNETPVDERSVPGKQASVLPPSSPRARAAESTSTTREPLRLRPRAPVTDSRVAVAISPETSQAIEAPTRTEPSETAPEPISAGSRFGRWLKAVK